MAAEPRAALPSAPAADRTLSRRLGFEANCGQVDAQVQFVARGAAYTAFLTSTEAVLALGDRRGGHAVLRMEPDRRERRGAGGGKRSASGRRQLLSRRPARIARQRAGVPPRAIRRRLSRHRPRVLLRAAQAGVRLRRRARRRSEPDRSRHRRRRARRAWTARERSSCTRPRGDVRQPRPVAYQRIGGVRRPVAADYALDAEGQRPAPARRLRPIAAARHRPGHHLRDVSRRHRRRGPGAPRRRGPPRARRRREHLSDRHDALDGLSDDGRRLPHARRERGPLRDQALARRRRPLLDVSRRPVRGLRARHRGRRRRQRLRHRRGERRRHLRLDPRRAGREARSERQSRLRVAPRRQPGRLVVRNRDRGGRRGARVRHRRRDHVGLPDHARGVPDHGLPQRLSLRGRRIRRQAERRRQRARLLDAALRPGRRLARGHRDRRGRKRVRRRDHGVERLPARRPDRAVARRRCHRSQRVRLEAEPRRLAAPLLDVPRRLGERRDQRHRARRRREAST